MRVQINYLFVARHVELRIALLVHRAQGVNLELPDLRVERERGVRRDLKVPRVIVASLVYKVFQDLR
jgi:hypothetical protein